MMCSENDERKNRYCFRDFLGLEFLLILGVQPKKRSKRGRMK